MGKVSKFKELENKEISILLVDDHDMRELNKKYRGINKSTDVLSFSQLDENSPNINPQPIGDIVISLDRAHDDAQTFHITFWEEMTKLLVHGVLHLLGYDHEKEEEAEVMEREEEKLLAFVVAH